ncbi:MAG: hypothetical protein PHR82_05955 [Endomicrobiaceae bacterium]|nr:hypothetical protein [Endomicrobiaceae bacterium]
MKKTLSALTVLFFFSCGVFADGSGTTMFQVLNIPITARDGSLAGMNVISSQNPVLMITGSYDFYFTQAFYLVDTKYNSVCARLPLGKSSAFGISVVYFDYGNITKTYSDGSGGYTENGSFGASDKVVALSYGLFMTERLIGGISAKYVKQDIDDVSYTGYASDISILYLISKKVAVESGIANYGSKVDGYSMPSNFYLGMFGKVTKKTEIIAQISSYYNDDLYNLKMAAETGFEKLMLRIGYNFPLKKQSFFDANDSIINNFTLGIGLNFDFFKLDYAWLPEGDLGNIHMFTLRIKI